MSCVQGACQECHVVEGDYGGERGAAGMGGREGGGGGCRDDSVEQIVAEGRGRCWALKR